MTIDSPPLLRPERRMSLPPALAAAAMILAGVAVLLLAATGASWARLSPLRSAAADMALAARPGAPPHAPASAATSPAEPTATDAGAMTPAQALALNASRPVSALPNPASASMRLTGGAAEDQARAVDCLAAAVYYEAGSQSLQGRRAVAQVVLNRLARPAFPKTVCGVVFQGANLATGCQFTFTCDGSLNRSPSATGWSAAREVAAAALAGYVEPSVGGATHYHTVWVAPYWSGSLIKVATVGAHIFYVWPGAGSPSPSSAVYVGAEPDPSRAWNVGSAPFGARLATADTGAEPAAATSITLVPPVRAERAPRTLALVTSAPLDDASLMVPPAYKLAQTPARSAGAERSRLPVPGDW